MNSITDAEHNAPPRLALRRALKTQLAAVDESPAREYVIGGEHMICAPFAIRVDTSIEKAIRALLRLRVDCLPVLEEDGRLADLVSESNVPTVRESDGPAHR